MSIEFRLASNCPHETLYERIVLASDRKSMTLSQPVVSSNTIKLYADEIEIPNVGLKSVAVLYTGQPGPFDLDKNTSSLTINYSQGSVTLNLVLSSKKRYSADELISLIRKAGFRGTLENNNGSICLYDTFKVGTDSFIEVSGSMSNVLFPKQKKAIGKLIYPSWRLVSSQKYPQFSSMIRTNVPLFVSYVTNAENCLRCAASYVENDISFADNGEPYFIDDEDHLYQASLKLLLTEKGSNSFFPWYGTSISERIGSKSLGSVVAALTDEVRRALIQYQKIQKEQSNYQTITAKERLYNVLSVKVNFADNDPRIIYVEVVVQNASNQPVKLEIVYTVPGVIALAGTNGLSLGTQRLGI